MFWSSCFEYHKQHCVCVRRKEGEGGRGEGRERERERRETEKEREGGSKGAHSLAVLLAEVGWLTRD